MSATALPSVPPEAARVFGEYLPGAHRFVELLAGEGIDRGLLGPREVPRLWDRHLLNCAGLAELIGPDCRVVDVGSGAGLPGLAIALARPDLTVELVEPLERRTRFLELAVAELELGDQVTVVRGRAQERSVRRRVGNADAVVSRAVAPLDRLVEWCLPLARSGGEVLAIKGRSAATELAENAAQLASAGAEHAEVLSIGEGAAASWVVRLVRRDSRHGERDDR